MILGYVDLYCPMCGVVFSYGKDKGTYHHKSFGQICSRECFEQAEIKYAKMILGKDSPI